MELAPHVDQMVLFSGAGEFRSLVKAPQSRSVRVTVVSTIATEPPAIGDELRRQADAFVDLLELKPAIAREQRPIVIIRQPIDDTAFRARIETSRVSGRSRPLSR